MPTLFITEFAIAQPVSGALVLPLPPLAEQGVELNSKGALSAEFNGATNLVRLVADVSCAVAVGQEPEAGAHSMQLAAGVPECFTVPTGHPVKLSAVLVQAKKTAAARAKPATKRGRRK